MGYTGKVARIDLSTASVRSVTLDSNIYRLFLGGRGVAGNLIRPHVHHSWTDPKMPIVLFAGPLVGTGAPSTDGLAVLSRSPLTGTVGDTMIYGAVGSRLKQAGWDGLIVTGRSPHPVGLEITPEKIHLRDASDDWGTNTFDLAPKHLQLNDIISIGPAGENRIVYAGLASNAEGTTGRSGIGAVFGAKRLKYIGVSGEMPAPLLDGSEIEDVKRLASASPALLGRCGIGAFGAAALFDLLHSRRMMPTDNFRATSYAPAALLGADAIKRRFSPTVNGCPSCFVRCKRGHGEGVLPDFDALSHFTALITNPDLDLAVSAIDTCHKLGLDPISTASIIAFDQETSGRYMKDGALIDFVEDLAAGRGRGEAYGSGLVLPAAKLGAAESAMAVKGLPLSAFDPRGALGTALSLAVATTGGTYKRANLFSSEILRKPVPTDRFSFAGKARMVKVSEDLYAVTDALVACNNIFLAASIEEYAAFTSTVLHRDVSGADLMRIGERIYYQERMMNSRLGFDMADDDLPKRFFTEPGSPGPGFDTPAIDRNRFMDARQRYYRVRGLSPDGHPTARTADRLELEWSA